MTVGAEIVGARYFHFPYGGEDSLGAQFPILSPVAAGTRDGSPVNGRGGELQKLGQSGCPGTMHGRTHRHFDGFQIQTPRLAALLKDDAQQLAYFVRDFLLDRFGRFFSWGVCSGCSMGRKRQILRFTSTNLLVNARNLRNSAISPSAFRTAASDGRFCVAVLRSIFCVS